MTGDQYLKNILLRENVNTGPFSPVRACQQAIMPTLQRWGNGFLIDVSPSGSFAKGTANRSGTDIDLFLSVSDRVPDTLQQIYDSLFTAMQGLGVNPRRQNVSIGVTLSGLSVDLVPGKRQNALTMDHSLYRRRANTWTKTNVQQHINLIAGCGRRNEIRIIKLWRNQRGLDFPSFYLELTVIEALRGRPADALAENVSLALEYLRDHFVNARVVDPANTNNILSDELSDSAKKAVAAAANISRAAPTYSGVVSE